MSEPAWTKAERDQLLLDRLEGIAERLDQLERRPALTIVDYDVLAPQLAEAFWRPAQHRSPIPGPSPYQVYLEVDAFNDRLELSLVGPNSRVWTRRLFFGRPLTGQ